MQRVRITLSLLAVVAVCGLAAGESPTTVPEEKAGPRAVDESPGASPAPEYARAPDFVLKSLTGENLRLSEFIGRVVVLNFWASWSGRCRQEMPWLQKLHDTYASAGLTVLGVNLDDDGRRAAQFVRALKISYPVLFDTRKQVAPLYGLRRTPMTVLIDRAGRVRHVHTDYAPGAEQSYVAQLRALLDE